MKDIYDRTNNICLVFLTMCAATVALIYMKPVLIPLIFAIFAYSVLTPMVSWIMRKTKAPKSLAVFLALHIFFLLLTGVVLVLISSVGNFVEGAPKYKESLTGTLAYLEGYLSAFDINLDF